MTKENLKDLNQLWYHIMKSVIGAVLNINHNIAELILGLPPIHIQTQVNSIKHFLKIINFTNNNILLTTERAVSLPGLKLE